MRRLAGIVALGAVCVGVLAVLTLYLLIPVRVTVGMLYPGNWPAVIIGLAALALAEIGVLTVLRRTTGQRIQEQPIAERRASLRRPVSFDVDLEVAHGGRHVRPQPLRARASDISAGGLAVLVDPGEWEYGDSDVRLLTQLPGDDRAMAAEVVALSDVSEGGDTAPLLRLHLRGVAANGHHAIGNGHAAFGGLHIANGTAPAVNGAGVGVIYPHSPTRGLTWPWQGVPAAVRRAALRLGTLPRSLVIILFVQIVASLILQNTAYQDEALYLYAGKQILHQLLGQPVAAHYGITSLSGFPYTYPVIAGILDSAGGLGLVRLFSLLCMLSATVCVFDLGRTLVGRSSAPFAAALFAVQAPVLFLGNFATYDAMCLALTALSALLAVYAGAAHRPWLALAVGPTIALAVLTKYAGLLFVPSVFALLAFQTWRNFGRRQAVLRTSLALSVLAIGALVILAHIGHDLMTTLNSAYLERRVASPDSRLHLMDRVWSLAPGMLVLATVGLVIGGRRDLVLKVLLFGSALLAPAYHIYEGELIALHKHLAFGLVFAAPLAGPAVLRIANRRLLTGIVICVLLLSVGLAASKELFYEWPDTAALLQTLSAQNLPPQSHVLAEPAYEGRYYLDASKHWDWTSLWYFRYTDAAGRHLDGVPAYRAAIADGYFDLVVLGYGPGADTRATARLIDSGLRHGAAYRLVGRVPYDSAFGTGRWWIWRKVSVHGAAASQGGTNQSPSAPHPALHADQTAPARSPGGIPLVAALSIDLPSAGLQAGERVPLLVHYRPRVRVEVTISASGFRPILLSGRTDGQGALPLTVLVPARAAQGTSAQALVTVKALDASGPVQIARLVPIQQGLGGQ